MKSPVRIKVRMLNDDHANEAEVYVIDTQPFPPRYRLNWDEDRGGWLVLAPQPGTWEDCQRQARILRPLLRHLDLGVDY